jgi:phospholipid transport system substrate-binding protein
MLLMVSPIRGVAVTMACLLALLIAREAGAGVPSDQLQGRVQRVVRILEDPALKRQDKRGERREAIRTAANDIFDFREISARTLGRHWQQRTPAERDEFVRLFSALLEWSYFSKIETFSGEKVVFTGESLDGDVAMVRTRIVTKQGTEIPVDYRMFRQGDRWRVYDVTIEGISLVANYRTQFNAIIQRSGYPELVKKLKEKLAEPPAEEAAKRRAERLGVGARSPGPSPDLKSPEATGDFEP